MRGKDILLVTVSTAFVAGVAYVIYTNKKVKNTMEKLGVSIDEISNNIDISEKIIEEAVAKAATKATDLYLKNTVNETIKEVERSINRAAKAAVDNEFENYKPLVKEAVEKKINQIDISEIKGEIIDSATKQMSKKFEADVNGLVDDYKKNLSNIDKICKNLTGLNSSGNGITFTLR